MIVAKSQITVGNWWGKNLMKEVAKSELMCENGIKKVFKLN